MLGEIRDGLMVLVDLKDCPGIFATASAFRQCCSRTEWCAIANTNTARFLS